VLVHEPLAVEEFGPHVREDVQNVLLRLPGDVRPPRSRPGRGRWKRRDGKNERSEQPDHLGAGHASLIDAECFRLYC
jgi:hypothetical protein